MNEVRCPSVCDADLHIEFAEFCAELGGSIEGCDRVFSDGGMHRLLVLAVAAMTDEDEGGDVCGGDDGNFVACGHAHRVCESDRESDSKFDVENGWWEWWALWSTFDDYFINIWGLIGGA